MDLISLIKEVLSILTITSHFVLIIFLIIIISKLNKLKSIQNQLDKIKKHSIKIAFIVALIATLGSLFFSEIALFEPCELCWFQRIFMYPLVLIIGIAILKKDNNVSRYVLPMSIIGSIIAGYHYIISTFSKTTSFNVCSSTTSCLTEYFTKFGYINIPMMALTAFIIIIIMSLYSKGKN